MTTRARVWTTDERASGVLARGMRPAICEVRIGKPEDLAFVVEVWADRMKKNRPTGERTRRARILLARPESRLIIAHVPGEPDAILGWAATEDGRPACIHYIYVRRDARGQGVARAMVGYPHVALEYSTPAPLTLRVPALWVLNIKRGETK